MNTTSDLIARLMKDKLPLDAEDAKRLKEKGYGPYLNGLRLKFGEDKVVIGKGLDRFYYLIVFCEVGGKIHYLTFKLTGIFENDKTFLEDSIPLCEKLFTDMALKETPSLQVERTAGLQVNKRGLLH